jgi:hypothetical protein
MIADSDGQLKQTHDEMLSTNSRFLKTQQSLDVMQVCQRSFAACVCSLRCLDPQAQNTRSSPLRPYKVDVIVSLFASQLSYSKLLAHSRTLVEAPVPEPTLSLAPGLEECSDTDPLQPPEMLPGLGGSTAYSISTSSSASTFNSSSFPASPERSPTSCTSSAASAVLCSDADLSADLDAIERNSERSGPEVSPDVVMLMEELQESKRQYVMLLDQQADWRRARAAAAESEQRALRVLEVRHGLV